MNIYEIEKKYAASLEEISSYLYENPELPGKEYNSSRYLADFMEKSGFKVTIPFCGLDTAFIAEYGEGPQLDFLAEYDALPGYGPEKKPAHTCGHNWIAAETIGCALVVKDLIDSGAVKLKVRLVGTPAEEINAGKIPMVRQGVFGDTVLAMQSHLGTRTECHKRLLALNKIKFIYEGKASHAAAAPWDGINALDAVNLLFAGVNAMRQQLKPDVRVHGIVSEGGQAPNIIPEKASGYFFVRSSNRDYLDQVIERVKDIARGAALMTGTVMTMEEDPYPVDDYAVFEEGEALAEKYLRAAGLPPEDSAYASGSSGSSDIGNVSHACPTIFTEIGLKGFKAHEAAAADVVNNDEAKALIHKVVCLSVEMALDYLGIEL